MAGISFSGLASGIDSDAIIKATTDTKRLQLIPLENTLAFNDQETEGLDQFNSKLLALADSMRSMTTAFGGAVAKEAVSSNSDVVEVTATASSTRISTQLAVKQLAKAATVSFNDRFSSIDTPLVPGLTSPQMIEIQLGQGDKAQTFSIEISNTTTLTNLVDAINAAAEDKLRASVVNVGSAEEPQYLLLVNGVDTGLEKGTLSITIPEEVKNQGVFSSLNLEQASNSIVSITGIGDVQRQSNEITDLLPGMTIKLKTVSTAAVQLSVGLDSEKTAKDVANVLAQVNELIKFSKDNSKVERSEKDGKVTNTFSSLAKTRIDDNAVRAIQSAISDSKADIEGATVNVLADMGITISRDGTYTLNDEKFLKALKADPEAATQVLQKMADKLASSTGVINEYTRYQGQIKIALEANESENESLNAKITRMEELFDKQAETMKLLFARLEETMANLNAQASSLLSMLSSSSS